MAGGGVHRAMEQLRFGPRRTLNVRDALLSGAEASRRVDGWLRGRQLEMSGDVLVITGRGLGSVDGVSVVREATMKTLHSLRRAGVISAFQTDTPGSFVVTLAPLGSLLDAPARRRRKGDVARRQAVAVTGLGSETHARLRDLAVQSLEALGVVTEDESLIAAEMQRQFSRLVPGAPSGQAADKWLLPAIERAIGELEDAGDQK